MSFRVLLLTATIGVAVSTMAWGASASADAQLALPPQPDPTSMENAYPACDFKPPLASLRHCASQLELFRQYDLESYNNRVRKYIVSLKSFDAVLEIERVDNKIDAAIYANLHSQVAQQLSDASDNNGDCLEPYRKYFQKYSDDIAADDYAIRICITTVGCT